MPPKKKIKVDTGVLRQHATRVESLSDDVGLAGDASAEVNSDAFGLMCSFLVPFVVDEAEAKAKTIKQSSTTLEYTANGVRAMADQYDADEQDAEFRLRKTYP